jgi:hypothetical protein
MFTIQQLTNHGWQAVISFRSKTAAEEWLDTNPSRFERRVVLT